MVRLPAHIWSAVTKLNRTKAELKQGNAAPTPAQIAQKMGTTENKVLQASTSIAHHLQRPALVHRVTFSLIASHILLVQCLQLETWAKDVYELDRKAPGAKGSEGSPVLDLISAPDSDSFDPLEQVSGIPAFRPICLAVYLSIYLPIYPPTHPSIAIMRSLFISIPTLRLPMHRWRMAFSKSAWKMSYKPCQATTARSSECAMGSMTAAPRHWRRLQRS